MTSCHIPIYNFYRQTVRLPRFGPRGGCRLNIFQQSRKGARKLLYIFPKSSLFQFSFCLFNSLKSISFVERIRIMGKGGKGPRICSTRGAPLPISSGKINPRVQPLSAFEHSRAFGHGTTSNKEHFSQLSEVDQFQSVIVHAKYSLIGYPGQHYLSNDRRPMKGLSRPNVNGISHL